MKPLAFLFLLFCSLAAARADGLKIVAAENFYGSLAQQIAGPDETVTSILSNPNQDPHEFTTNASTAKAVADADIVIYNGAGYDDWMDKLLAADGKKGRVVICVAKLAKVQDGANPHLWYNPDNILLLGSTLAQALTERGVASDKKPVSNLYESILKLKARIALIAINPGGLPKPLSVTATEPVFGYMATALGFKMLNEPFQYKVMNDTEPSAAETAAFEKSLTSHEAKLLFYNSQVSDPATERLKAIAEKAGIPVIGVTETMPAQYKTYAEWMNAELDEVEAALKKIGPDQPVPHP
jgi:zinc/manganese transport system substrate-binding protein